MNNLVTRQIFVLALAGGLVGACLSASAEPQAAGVAGAGGGKVRLCLVHPKAQLGQGTNATSDVGEPVMASLATYLSGPTTEVVPLTSRILPQVQAEATQQACAYVVATSIMQKKGGSGFGSLLAAAPALAGAIPFMGGMSGSAGAYQAAAVAQAAAQGAAAVQQQQAQQDAAQAMSGVAQSNIKKGDRIILEYKLYRGADPTPITTKTLNGKAESDGHDVLSPLLEQVATDVVTLALQPH